MISVAVKIETECSSCRMPMPVNTLACQVSCPSCGRPTAIGAEHWQALLRYPVYDGPRMLRNEGRRRGAGRLFAYYTRLGPCCQGCEKALPATNIVEVREQAMLRCDRCAEQTWVRAVPAEFTGVLPNITHLVGEDPDPLVARLAAEAQAATFPCPQCGSPVPFDGVTRTYVCRFCSASVHVPDEFVYRGRRKLASNWFLCFHPSITDQAPAAQAVVVGLFDWVNPPDVAVDADGNLYCAARQQHWVPGKDLATEKMDDVLWSVDPSLNVRWLQRGGSRAVRLVLSPKGVLLVPQRDKSSRPWLSATTGRPVEGPGAAAQKIDGEIIDCNDLTCDRDGSVLVLKDGKLRRIASNGAELDVWPGVLSAGDDAGSRPGPRETRDRAVDTLTVGTRVHCGPDGSIYLMGPREITRFDGGGRKIYGVELICSEMHGLYRNLGADLCGNAYVLCSDRLVRISAGGAQSVVLEKRRDDLPRSEMSLAVCPDGSFWLFGTKGSAWKFGTGGVLLFSSEKEPRPRKPTQVEISQWGAHQEYQQRMAQANADFEQMLQLQEAQRETEHRNKRIGALIVVVMLMCLLLLSSPGVCTSSR